jgi:hypothetical protein
MTDDEQLIYSAWKDSETYQVPMTEEGERLAKQRWYDFKQGWEYAQFYKEHNHIERKDYDDNT